MKEDLEQIKKFLYSIKGAVMGMDIDSMSESALIECYNNIKNLKTQQDYIIIDWEGKDQDDVAKKAEVDAILKNIYLANQLALLSVIFKNMAFGGSEVLAYYPIVSFIEDDGEVAYGVALPELIVQLSFSLT